MEEYIFGHKLQLFVAAVQCGIIPFVWSIYNEHNKRSKARDEALRSILRTEIIRICMKAEKRSCLFMYELENLNDMFCAYSALGGNGAVKALYETTIKLPHSTVCDKE